MISLTKNMRSMRGLAAGITLLATAGLTSCMDDLETPDLPPVAYVSIYQGSPDATGMDIFANGNKVNQSPLSYSQALAYSQFYPGDRNFRFSPSNSATALLEKEFTLAADSVYSMFVVNESENLDAVLVKDEWNEPSTDQAQIRLANLSPDSPAVYLVINDENVEAISETTFQSVSEFVNVPKGNAVLEVKSVDTDETLITSGTLELKGNRVYTLVLKGLKSEATGDKKLDIQLITNYIYY